MEQKQPDINACEYRTGATNPPKSHSGGMAFLLVTIIFISGIFTVLGAMNIRLFHAAGYQSSPSSVVFSQETPQSARMDTVMIFRQENDNLGLSGRSVPYFWQRFRQMPNGLYVTAVSQGSAGCNLGICPGDIILSVNHSPVTEPENLQQLLSSLTPGEKAEICLYRHGKELYVTARFQEE